MRAPATRLASSHEEARASSGTRDRSVGRRRCIGLATWSGLCSHGSEAQGFWSSVACPPPRRRDARPALSRISFGLRMEYHSADCASNRLCARAFYYARAVSLYCVTLSEFAPLQASCLRVWNARKSRPRPKAGALTTSEPRFGGTSGYLVDPASSHMLVSKIKPCMSKYKRSCTVKLRMAHYISYSLFDSPLLHGYP